MQKKRHQKLTKEWQSLVSNQIRKFSSGLLGYFGELQPDQNFIFYFFAEKIFVCQTLKANVLSTLNWFIDRIFIPIAGMQFQQIS